MSEGQQQRQSGGGNQGGGGGGGGGQKPRKKPFFALSNMLGFVVWLVSATLTSIAVTLLATPKDATPITAQLWYQPVLYGVALVTQMVFTVCERTIKDPLWKVRMRYLDYAINIFGLYYLFCEILGLFPEVKDIVHYAVEHNSLGVMLPVLFVVFIAVFLEAIANRLFDAPQ